MANKKITDLSAASELTGDDLFPVVDAPGGTATTKKVTADVAGAYLGTVNAKIAIGYEWFPFAYQSTSTVSIWAQDLLTLYAAYSPMAMTISNVRIRVGTTPAPASTTWRLGAYTDVDGKPTSLITDFGTVDPTTAGVKNISGLSTSLPFGRFWVAVCMQGTATTGGQYFSGYPTYGINVTPNGTSTTNYTQTSVSGALPATFTGSAATGLSSPLNFGFTRSA